MQQIFAGKSAWPRYTGTEDALVLSAGHTSSTADLLAVGSQSRLVVLQVHPKLAYYDGDEQEAEEMMRRGEASGARLAVPEELISVNLEAAVTAMAWSPVSTGPPPAAEGGSEHGKGNMRVEIAVALEDGQAMIYTHLGEGTTSFALGHLTGRVNSLDWLNVGDTSYIAAAQGNGTLTIWTLIFSENEDEVLENPGARSEDTPQIPRKFRQDFTYPHPLLTAAFHPHATGTLLVLDSAGSLRMLDWLDPVLSSRTNSSLGPSLSARKPRAQHTLVNPRAYSNARSIGRGAVASASAAAAAGSAQSGSASWKSQDENVIGALIEGRWCIWDSRVSAGNGLPVEQGEAYSERGGGGFKWCPTNAQLFLTFSAAPSAAPARGSARSAGPGYGSEVDDYPLTIYDRSSLTLSAPRRISRTSLLPFETGVLGGFHGNHARAAQAGGAGGGGGLAGTSSVRGERVRDAEWVGSTLGGGIQSGPRLGGPGASGGLGDVVAVAMGREVIFVSLALIRN
ncbi:hypothetical protein CF327_g5107 [Tilletia walkeri]|nr:hypothetical protein CF327_g5107 [Tilletia walkeri]